MNLYTALAIPNADDLVFGTAVRSVEIGGLTIGGGTVYPELNFTLPPMKIAGSSMDRVLAEYEQMSDAACARAVALEVPGLVLELELLPELTRVPSWGAEVTGVLRRTLDTYRDRHGLPSALRVTPNDNRDFIRPPLMAEGPELAHMMTTFEACAQAGADMLAIESTGGKELSDDALLNGDLTGLVFALGVLGARDMESLWDMIVGVADRHKVIASGDSACGFANTAMALATGGLVPRVWAAVVRVLVVARSLVAYERGAVGPSKDCAYEGPFIKAITGCPISLEGAEAACAHLSPIGNIAKATADLWSNESVQNVKLLGGMAPTISMEQLAYAVRLMNVAAGEGQSLELRNWLVASDAARDPQAYVLRPDVVVEIASAVVAEPTAYLRTRRTALTVLEVLRRATASGQLLLSRPEQRWLSRLSVEADGLPEDEGVLVAQVTHDLDPNRVRLDQYGFDA